MERIDGDNIVEMDLIIEHNTSQTLVVPLPALICPESTPSGSACQLVNVSSPRWIPQVLAAVTASLVNLAAGASMAFVAATLALLRHESSRVQITDDQVSWMASLLMLGALLGGLLSGPCNSRGRRLSLWLCAFPLLGVWVVLATAINIIMFYTSHFVFGLCMGIANDVVPLYVSEISQPSTRGALGCIPILTQNFGIMLFYLAALFELPWGMLAWVGAALTLPAVVLPAFLPESPSYLASHHRQEDALVALCKLHGSAWDAGPVLEELMGLDKPKVGLWAQICALRERCAIRSITVVAFIRLFSRFCGMRAIQLYIQRILLDSNSSISKELGTFITGLVQFVSITVACFVMEQRSRRFYLFLSFGGMTISLLVLALYLTLKVTYPDIGHGWIGVLPMICIVVYLITNSLGLTPISGLILGEMVPQRHRCIASSITGVLSWLSAFIVTKIFFDMVALLHLKGTLFMYAGVCVVGIVFTLLCVPETRGITYMEIENLFESKPCRGIER